MSQVTFPRVELLAALNRVAIYSPKGKRMPPILRDTVKIYANGSIELAATDSESMAVESVHYKEKRGEDWAKVAPCRPLVDFLKSSKSEWLTISKTDEGLRVVDQTKSTVLTCEDPERFPGEIATPGDLVANFLVDASKLRASILATIDAIDYESSRYQLGGLFFELSGDSIAIVGTDGRRLHVVELPVITTGPCMGDEFSAIIPGDTCEKLAKTLAKMNTVEFRVNRNSVEFVIFGDDSQTVVTSRKTEGRFPAWRQVIPAAREFPIELDVSQWLDVFADVCKAVGKNSETPGVDLVFQPESHFVDLAWQTEKGKFSLPFDNGRKNGFDFKMAFILDCHYLRDAFAAIKAMGETTAAIACDAEGNPVLIKAGKFKAVIMPIQRGR